MPMADFSKKVDEHLKFRATNGAEGSLLAILAKMLKEWLLRQRLWMSFQ
jgi:hypothetical protein